MTTQFSQQDKTLIETVTGVGDSTLGWYTVTELHKLIPRSDGGPKAKELRRLLQAKSEENARG